MAKVFLSQKLFRNLFFGLLFSAGYIGSALLVLRFMSGNGIVAAFWPPSGVALASLLLGGRRYLPLIFLGAFTINLIAGCPWWVAVILGFANFSEAVLGFWLLTVLRPINPRLGKARDYFRLFLYAGILAPAPSAIIGATALNLTALTREGWLHNFQFWWMGDSLGVIVFAPLILIWRLYESVPLRTGIILEGAAAFLISLALGQMIFLGWFNDTLGFKPQAFIMFFLMTWAAVRFGRHAAMLLTMMIITQVMAGSSDGHGFFAGADRKIELINIWLYITVLAATGMALATFVHERKKSLERLSRVTANLEQVSAIAHIGGWELDVATMRLWFSDEALRIVEVEPGAQLSVAEAMSFMGSEDQTAHAARVKAAIENRQPWDAEFAMTTAVGNSVWVRSQGAPVLKEGKVIKLTGTVHDLTDRKRADQAVRESEERYRKLVESSADATIVHQGGVIVYVNPAAVRILQMSKPDELLHRNLMEIVPLEDRAMILGPDLDTSDNALREGRLLRSDGKAVEVEVSAAETVFNGRLSTMIVARDISERKRAEEQIRFMGQHDMLTGLPNRALFADRLSQVIALASAHRTTFALLFLDLDHFKKINDSLGHQQGDRFLKEVATRLTLSVKDIDTVSRQGGDEFLLLLNDLGHAEDAALVAQKICHALTVPFIIAKNRVSASASIGVAVYPRDGITPETLIKNADIAMYHAKDKGRNQFQFFSEELNRITHENLEIETALRDAIRLSQLRVFYQPQLNVKTGEIDSCEALLRWNHPERGNIPPGRFIPLAEESGQISDIGRWVLKTVAADYRILADAGYPGIRISVNVSAQEIQNPDFSAGIKNIITAAGMPSEALELEVTESMILEDTARAIRTISELSEQGIRLSIDDFGTGYSSLSYLRQLKIHDLKIDQSFVRDLMTDPDDAAIVRTIIGLAKNLRLQVTAEGVETEEQRAFLVENGCDRIQGFLLSEALSFTKFQLFLQTHALKMTKRSAGRRVEKGLS